MSVERLIKCESPVCGEERVALQTCALCQILSLLVVLSLRATLARLCERWQEQTR
jgi:hypothetical protein